MFYKPVLILLIMMFLSGCAKNTSLNKTHYYQFYGQNNNLTVVNTTKKPMLLISDITLPGSLNNRGIAMRVNQHRLQNANWHLWSTSPDEMLLTNMASNLVFLQSDWLFLTQKGPVNQVKNDLHFEVKWYLNKFNGGLDNDAEISGLWQLYKHHGDGTMSLVKQQYFNETQALKEDGYIGLVSALESLWFKVNKNFLEALNRI
ncbi:membrane integrity-associated transporter subunit PqiC [Pseudoalteromonas sp. C2R02]|uniref:PqiC family protein n=1 Tax=Pseudoalteromonas sp. C2R02 TaxID=2841565 RepID=UPI001C0A2012|nr:ABC-type transport auxiliary lipoprotein family protein [Pseudoalteromonas sp. C2R02]MBU2970544.1 membrane integrity-associated transporter subunit PqiC [Pseudoalteromonas sp. C2R02]